MRIVIEKKETILLIILVLVAFLLRFYLLPEKLFFGPEQGRDFLVVKHIVQDHALTLIGSKTDINGIFHGPIFYYLAILPFLLSKGDPVVISAFFVFINAITVIPLYFLAKNLFNKQTALIAGTLFAVSYAGIVYARWLSNPPLSIPISALFFLSLYYFLKKEDWYLCVTALFFGALVQIQFLNLIFFSAILFVLLGIHIPRLRKTNPLILLISCVLLVGLSIGNFLLFDVRHEFLITKSIATLLSGKSGFYLEIGKIIPAAIQTFSRFFMQAIFPSVSFAEVVVGSTIGTIALFGWYSRDKKIRASGILILIWLLLPLTILILLRHDVLFHFFIPLLLPMILVVSFLINKLVEKRAVIGVTVLLCIILANIFTFIRDIPKNQHIFFQETQPDLTLKDQKNVIDAVYKDAQGHPFSFQSYTIPYWSQQAWEYLFWRYGQLGYGYYPVPEKAERLYVIIQSDPSSQKFQDDWLNQTVKKWGTEVKEFQYGTLTVKRLKVTY